MVVRYNSWQNSDSLERQFNRIIEGALTPTYRNDYGILNFTLPKSEEEKNKVVKVNLS